MAESKPTPLHQTLTLSVITVACTSIVAADFVTVFVNQSIVTKFGQHYCESALAKECDDRLNMQSTVMSNYVRVNE